MQMKQGKRTLSLLVCCALLAAAALFTTGCNGSTTTSEVSSAAVATSEAAPAASEAATPDTAQTAAEAQVVGQGETAFTFTVADADGQETVFEVHTDCATVGEALTELGLIEGEDSEYGLYVKTVNGITVDYDTDGKYWAFYVDGEYAQTGVDSTDVTPGSSYAFRVE